MKSTLWCLALPILLGMANQVGDLEKKILEMSGDPDLRVRLQAALTLGELKSPEKVDALLRIARQDASDPWMRSALLSSVTEESIDLYQKLMALLESEEDLGPVREGIVDLVENLAKILGTRGEGSEIEGLLRTVAKADPERNEAAAVGSLRGLSEGLELAEGGNLETETIATSLASLLVSPSQDIRGESKRVAGVLLPAGSEGLEGLVGEAIADVSDESLPPPDRIRAIETLRLGNLAQVSNVLGSLLDPRHPESLSLAALEVLDSFDEEEVAAVLVERWRGMGPSVREKALEILFARKERLTFLLASIESGDLQPWAVDRHRQALLLQFPDKDIAAIAGRLFGATSEGEDAALFEKYRASIDLAGDSEKGQVIYRQRCTLCHKVGEEGVQLGPDWSSVTSNTREALLISILYPNRAVDPGFTDYVVETEGGNVVNGIMVASGDTSITLRRSGGEENTVLRKTIKSIRDTKLSIMPKGLEAGLSEQEMADLLTFIQSLQ